MPVVEVDSGSHPVAGIPGPSRDAGGTPAAALEQIRVAGP